MAWGAAMPWLLLSLLLNQPNQGTSGPDFGSDLGTYTAWGIITVLGGVVAALSRAYVRARDEKDREVKEARDERDRKLEDINKQLTGVVASYAEAATMQKTSNYQMSDALKQFALRLEKLEDKVDAGKQS